MRKLFTFIALSLNIIALPLFAQKTFSLKSPDGKIEVAVAVDKTVSYSVKHDGDVMLGNSQISLSIENGADFGLDARLSGSAVKTVNQTITPVIYKRSQIKDNYSELTLKFKGAYNIIFRAYDDGAAYRFVYTAKKPITVENEQAEFNFPDNCMIFASYANKPETLPLEEQYKNSFEQPYNHILISEWNRKRLGITPFVAERANGKKVCITEADLLNYPGMFVYPGEKGNRLKGVFAPYPKETEQSTGRGVSILVKSREKYIAKYDGAVTFPWRVIAVSANDRELADNDMIYKLSTPEKGDFSWVKPGKVAWDWWNDWNIYGVDFKSGVNNETYKYYIDFASKFGIEYIILDEGWAVSDKFDLLQIVPEINIPELIEYGKAKNVGIILWAGYYPFQKDMEGICKHYSELGVKGFKVDFMDRDDQPMVDFHRRAAEIAAKYKLMIDFHGTYKPTGLHHTYPNLINYEGVNGLEQLKWDANLDQVTYDVTIPFIRQLAGPMDYTQGAMRNATKDNYKSVYSEPISQGTRCRQLAEYVIFESPLSMLCDNPSNYLAEPECTEFIATVPTTWDNTISLNGEIGKYVTIARRKGDAWYIGSMTDWNALNLRLDLSFLGEGEFRGEVFKDGINAHRTARDYKKEQINIPVDRKLNISMAPGGGYVIKITRK